MEQIVLKILIHYQKLTEAEAQLAASQYKKEQGTLLSYLIDELDFCDIDLARSFADYFNLSCLYQDIEIAEYLLATEQLKNQNIITIKHKDKTHLAISDPNDLALVDSLSFQLDTEHQPAFIPYKKLLLFTNRLLNKTLFAKIDENNLTDTCQQIINNAMHRGISDIHFEPQKNELLVRSRCDGVLENTLSIVNQFSGNIISQLKLMAGLDIAEKRKPQDGRFTFTSACGIKRDCRLNACPTLFGEKIVIRLLTSEKNKLSFTQLGFDSKQVSIINKAINKPQGLILVTGPTGSGKTMTLYTMLQALNSSEKNISTIEDPIEIQLNGINQVNINPKIQFDFPEALRAFLRQDPDVIMIGEIRDKTTAELAIRAAHTGHLVLSTLHTNSAAETISRFINMGIKPFNLASTLSLIIAQRLIRLSDPGNKNELKGRTGIYEILDINDEIKNLITNDSPALAIKSYMAQQKIKSLNQVALDLVKHQLTTDAEALRVS